MEPNRTEAMADLLPDLLAELGWLQQLARELADDPELAADAVQDTCALALQHGGGVAHPRAWLATVLRNCLRLAARGQRASERRENAAARPEATTATAELVQRAELQQRLIAAVMTLPAPHRDAVLLRFFDGLPPRAIAERTGVPVATVHSRLQRALQQLRAELDRGTGSRAAWVALALPSAPALVAAPAAAAPAAGAPAAASAAAAAPALASAPAAASAGALSSAVTLGVLMQTKWMVAAAVLLAAGAVSWWWPRERAAEVVAAAGDDGPARRIASAAGGGASGAGAPADGARRTRIEAPPAHPDAPAAPRVAVRGLVLDCSGLPVPGVAVSAGAGAREEEARGDGVRGDGADSAGAGSDGAAATTDGGGRFELSLEPRATSLHVADDRFVTVLGASWAPASAIEPVLVVARAQTIGGTVIEPSGAAIAGAQVVLQLPADFDARLPVRLDRAQRVRWETRSGPDGTFRLERLPRIDGASLLAHAVARRPATVPLPPGDDERMQVVLQPFAYEQGQLDGVVVDPAGVPVPGARVAMGVTSTVTDGEGRFGLVLRRAGWPTPITAAKAGYLPARLELPRGGGADRADWPERVELRLGSEPLTMRGRVLATDGRPVPGAIVWASDPTLFGIVGVVPLQTEYLLAGGEVPPRIERMPVPFADDPTRDGDFMNQMGHLQQPNACWFFVEADENGSFELPGLLPRDYVLRALDPASGITGDAESTPAGGTVEIRIATGKVWPVLKGRIVSMRGEGVAGVDVLQCVLAFRSNERVPGGRFEGSAIRHGKRTRTGADGSFELRDVDAQHSFLSIYGDAILPRPLWGKDVADPTDVRIEVALRCHVEVALADPAEADQVSARDAQGETIDCVMLRSGSHQAETELDLHAGKSGVFVLDERATKLLLLRDGAVVREVPLQLVPGRTTLVQ